MAAAQDVAPPDPFTSASAGAEVSASAPVSTPSAAPARTTPVAPPPAAKARTGDPGVVTVGTGGSTFINVSAKMMNEVVVPYANPRVVKFLKPSSKASIQQDGNSIYVSTGHEEFIQLIIKDGDAPTAPGFSVTLIPVEDIPGQHIVLRAEGSQDAGPSYDSLNAADYVDMLRELMREAARETLPPVYSRDAGWNGVTLQVGPVTGRGLYRSVGNSFVVEYYELYNGGASGIELVETNFAQKGVRAVAFIDAVALAPGQTGRMVWVKDR